MLFHSETPAALLEAMSRELSRIREPRARHWLILPGKGRAEALVRLWTHRAGIASHNQEVQLRELVEQASADGGRRFNFESLRLAVASELPSICNEERPGEARWGDFPVPKGAVLSPISAAVLDLATHLARAIDDGFLCREPHERWAAGSFLETLCKKPLVTDALRSHIGARKPSEFEQSVQSWITSWEKRGGVPHLWVFLDAGLPRLQYERFVQMTAILERQTPGRVHLFALSPSQEYWADYATRRRKGPMPESSSQDSKEENQTSEPDFYPGGLLWAFGRCSQDLHRQLSDSFLSEGFGGHLCESTPPPDSLLGRLQLSCKRSSPLKWDERLTLAKDDASLTVHSCHSTLRELEVCRDRILQARVEMEDLRYEDILLLLADPTRQAPFVEAALRTNDPSNGGLPFRFQGSAKSIPSALGEGVSLLLEKIRGRLGLEDLQLLIEHPLIGAKFGFRKALEDGQDLISWLSDANFRWGLDAEHRTLFQGIPENRWNLLWAIQRIGLGSLVDHGQVGEVMKLQNGANSTVPLERATGLSLKGLAQLSRFANALRASRKLWRNEEIQTMSDWNTRLRTLVDAFMDCSAVAPAQHLIKLSNNILPALENSVPESNPQLTTDAYLRLLGEKLVSIGESGGWGPGGVCVADLKQYAGVPARMVLIAGLDDGSFSGAEDRPAWNPLSESQKTGDPSKRDSDRHALLLAVLGCQERLVLCYQGRSDEDAKERLPSTALADLLQAVDQTLRPSETPKNGERAHDQIYFDHPLNGFSPSAFAANQNSSARGFFLCDAAAASIVNQTRGLTPYAGFWTQILPSEQAPKLISLKSLQNLIREPTRLFLDRLGVRLPEKPEELEGGDLLKLNHLKKWSLRDRLLSARLEGRSEQALIDQFSAAGEIPRETLGQAEATNLIKELPELSGDPFAPTDRLNRTIRLQLNSPGETGKILTLEGQLRSGWYRREGTKVANFYSASSRSLKADLQLCLDAMALSSSFEDCPDECPESVQYFFKKAKAGSAVVFKLLNPKAARSVLESLVPLYLAARRLPLPFWPATSEAILKSFTQTAGLEPERIKTSLETGFFKWINSSSDSPADAESESARYVFRGCPNPLMWIPNIDGDKWLLGALYDGDTCQQPLAWRLAVFFDQWKQQAGLP